jgi:hypothetical protein
VFDRVLGVEPPGPIAETVASYAMPGEGSDAPNRVAKLTVIVFVPSGVGLPSDSV